MAEWSNAPVWKAGLLTEARVQISFAAYRFRRPVPPGRAGFSPTFFQKVAVGTRNGYQLVLVPLVFLGIFAKQKGRFRISFAASLLSFLRKKKVCDQSKKKPRGIVCDPPYFPGLSKAVGQR